MQRVFTLTYFSPAFVLLSIAAAIPAVQAQQIDLRLPALQTLESEARSPQTCSDVCPIGGDCQHPDYWIVSSRPCNDLSGHCTKCDFDYYRCSASKCTRITDSKQFQEWFQPDVPVCVVVHGSLTGFGSLRQGSLDLYRWVRAAAPNRPLQVVFYTWPSEGPITTLLQIDIGILGRRSAFHGMFLTQIMDRIPKSCPIGLFGHSHGARTIASALHLLGGGVVQGYRLRSPNGSERKIRVALSAAAIDHHWLNPGERYGRALCSVEHIVNLRNRHDLILGFYPLRRPFARRALGHSGFTWSDRTKMGWWSHKVSEMDVSHLIGHHHMWEHYYDCPGIAKAMVPYLYGDESSSTSGVDRSTGSRE